MVYQGLKMVLDAFDCLLLGLSQPSTSIWCKIGYNNQKVLGKVLKCSSGG